MNWLSKFLVNIQRAFYLATIKPKGNYQIQNYNVLFYDLIWNFHQTVHYMIIVILNDLTPKQSRWKSIIRNNKIIILGGGEGVKVREQSMHEANVCKTYIEHT